MDKQSVSKQSVLRYAKEQYGTEPDYLWHTEDAVLRRNDNQKWYGLIMRVRVSSLAKKYGDKTLQDNLRQNADVREETNVLNVKCDPLLLGALIQVPGILPAYHMNREHWVSILLDSAIPFEEVCTLVDMSYALTAPAQKKQK